MIVACFIQSAISVMLLLIEIKKRNNACGTYIRVRSQIFIFTGILLLSKTIDLELIRYCLALHLLFGENKSTFNHIDGNFAFLHLLPCLLLLY